MQNIILLHGALGSENDLKPLAGKLKTYNINPHLFSFSGHAGKGFHSDFGIEQFTNELDQFIVSNKLDKPHIFGYSMGGYVALNLAALKPLLIGSIVTLGTKFNWSKEVVERETGMLNPEILKNQLPNFAGNLKTKHGDTWEDLVTKTASMMVDIGSTKYVEHKTLVGIENKVMVGLGDRDKMVTYDETFNVYKSLPNCSMYMLPSAPHAIEKIDTETLAKLIAEFIKTA